MSNVWKELDNIGKWEEYQKTEQLILEDYLKEPSAILMEMACVRGNDIKLERLLFSFYFSSKEDVHGRHGIRVKIQWNPSKIISKDADGYLELHGDYDYVSGSHRYTPTSRELGIARDFFRRYKVLFSAVWEGKLHQNDLQHYFEGTLDWKHMLSAFDNVGEKGYYYINHCKNIQELEEIVRVYGIFNMND